MADQPTPPAPPATPTPSPKLLVPKNDAALAEIGRLSAQTWAGETWLTLRWLTQAAYAQLVGDFSQTMNERREAATSRSPHTQRLQVLDDELDTALRILKNYVLEEAGYDKAAATARYGSFGLQRRSRGGYALSTNRNERLTALRDFLLPAVQSAKFASRDYGTAFWQPRVAEYAALLGQAEGLMGRVAQSVSSKNEGKQQLRKALQALIFALRANYPDTYEAELRRWGFRKENY